MPRRTILNAFDVVFSDAKQIPKELSNKGILEFMGYKYQAGFAIYRYISSITPEN
jgi:hypothetical protein